MNELIIKDIITGLTEAKRDLIMASFAPVVESLNKFGKQFPDIQALEIGKDKCAKAKRFRIDFSKQITKADVVRKDLKEESLKEGNAVQTVFNYIKKSTEETKAAALAIETHFERIEAEKKAHLQLDRQIELAKYDSDGEFVDLGNMPDEVWKNYLAGVKNNYLAMKEAERKAEEDRVEAERIEEVFQLRRDEIARYSQYGSLVMLKREMTGKEFEDLFNEMVKADEKYKAEQAEIKAENERLKVEADKAEKKRVADQKKADAEKVKQDAKLKAEREKAEAEKRIQDEIIRKEREAREKLEQEARDKEAAERKEVALKAAEEKKAASAPDKEKLFSVATKLRNTKITVKNPAAVKALEDAAVLLEKVAGGL